MTTAWDRRVRETAQAATRRATELADAWEHAAPRRPINGHTPDCPNRHDGRMRRCSLCRAELLERGVAVVNGVPVPASSTLAAAQPPRHPDTPTQPCIAVGAPTETTPELRQCPRCFGPTTTPEEHCT